MTLFTLAGALISASYVCCVAPATSAALHNRFFEGFLQKKKKKGRSERTTTTTTKRKGKQRGQIHPRADAPFQNPHKWIRWPGFSLYLSSPLCLPAFLSLGLIRLHVEIEAIGEDS